MSDEAGPKLKKSTYVPTPQVPPEVQARLLAVLAVLTRQLRETEAAEQLGVSRHYFQTLKNRCLTLLIETLQPKPAGRPSKSPEVRTLEAEVQRLRKENARLQERVDMVDRMLGVASDLMRGKLKLTGRQKGAAKTKTAEASSDSDEPDGRERLAEGAGTLRKLGLPLLVIAGLLGVGESTVRRHLAKKHTASSQATPPISTAERHDAGAEDAHLEGLVENEVRRFRGCIGEEALRHMFGVSRRRARAIKSSTLTAMEVDRVRSAKRVTFSAPGIVRGFDAMYIWTDAGWRFLLVVGDSAVCFRTTVSVSEKYDGPAVAAVLERDFIQHGAPLFLRMDRAKCHASPEVTAVLVRHGVIALQGPPRHPRYYGQLERQNRELREWLDHSGILSPAELLAETVRMTTTWNSRLPRRTLGWRTAEERWRERPVLSEDRQLLRAEVEDRAARMQQQLEPRGGHAGLAMRLAIEATLKQRGWMTEKRGGWC